MVPLILGNPHIGLPDLVSEPSGAGAAAALSCQRNQLSGFGPLAVLGFKGLGF